MRVGTFELREPAPQLKGPHCFVMLSPWIDVGRVGSLALAFLESHFHGQELGKLARPGLFYDFTRYRPMIYLVEGRREIKIPNTFLNYAQRSEGGDLLFLYCMEPHALGDTYAQSILNMLEHLQVKRYCMVGSMYDSVPHTRPLIISGSSSNPELEAELNKMDIHRSSYQGPTTINVLVSENAPKRGIETMSMVVHLPHYAQLEEDYSGEYAVLQALSHLYHLSLDLNEIKQRAEEQYKRISQAVQKNPQMDELVKLMEVSYDARSAKKRDTELPLPPGIEKFLREIDKEHN